MSISTHGWKIIAGGALAVVLTVLAGCQQAMQDQPRYEPLEASPFFADGQASRPLVSDTVARGHLRTDAHLYAGMSGGTPADTLPFAVTYDLLARGRGRFDIYCSPCHGRLGNGDGMIVRRGFAQPPSLHSDRLRAAPVGHFFIVITHGFGAMPDYAAQISPEDRWAIVAYMRALQLSQHATLADVPAEERAKLPPEGRP